MGDNMLQGWVLIEEHNLNQEALRGLSLMNAKHLVVGSVPGSGVMVHVAASSPADLGKALLEFAQLPGVSKVLTLALSAEP